MGSANADALAESDEKPHHTVYLDAFWIDRTEVTNAQYKKCVQAGACKASGCANDSRFNGDNQPVACVEWDDASAYCEWAERRLPTEAEWEKAARSTDGRIYPWGNGAPAPSLLNFGRQISKTTDVGTYSDGASAYKAVDMAGNVWEWVADWYDAQYYASSPSKNPPGPPSGQHRVRRGGSWYSGQNNVRLANRGAEPAAYDPTTYGFRCVASP